MQTRVFKHATNVDVRALKKPNNMAWYLTIDMKAFLKELDGEVTIKPWLVKYEQRTHQNLTDIPNIPT